MQERTFLHEPRPLPQLPPLCLSLLRLPQRLRLHLLPRVAIDAALGPLHGPLEPPYFLLARGAQLAGRVGEQLPCALVVLAQRRELARVQVGQESILRAELVRCELAGCVREPGVSRFLEWSPPEPKPKEIKARMIMPQLVRQSCSQR